MKYLFILVCMAVSTATYAQKTTSPEAVAQTSFFVELGGPAILFSANLDKRFTKSKLGLGARAGIGFVSGYGIVARDYNNNFDGRNESVLTVPLQLNYIFGKPNSVHSLEVGAGVTVASKKLNIFEDFDFEQGSNVFGTASFMYRRLPKDGGFSWRLGFTPILTKGYLQPFVGGSIGFNF